MLHSSESRQALPQVPQFRLVSATHASPQHSSVPPQLRSQLPQLASSFGTQEPPQQSSEAPQAMPQPPQLSGSLSVSAQLPKQHTSLPSHAGSQSVHSGAVSGKQPPPQHSSPAAQLASMHAPQNIELVWVFTQLPSQHSRPAPQASPQAAQ